LEYRAMQPGEQEIVLALAMRAFDEYVRPDFSDEGVAEFSRAVHSFLLEHPPGHVVTVAVRSGEIVGMIDVKNNAHISLFFVDPAHMGRGIGRGLVEEAVRSCRAARPDLEAITVHSSPWAVGVYEKLGFSRLGPEREQDGIRFTEMVRPL